MKKLIRTVFRVSIFEKMLTYLLGWFPDSFLRYAVSSNDSYPARSIRSCNRYGVNYSLDINDYQNWLLYFYSGRDSSFGVLNYIRNEKIIFDVGGNIGQTAMMIAKRSGSDSTIYSFEPYPATFARFQKNLELNKTLSGKIRLQHVALGAVPGKLQMFEDCVTNSGANRIVPGSEKALANTTEVPVSTIDIFASENKIPKIDFIKIDVEGFEMEVLKGARETLIKDRPSLFIELDDANLKKQSGSAIELCEYLEHIGYNIYEEGQTFLFNFRNVSKPVNIYCSSKSILQ